MPPNPRTASRKKRSRRKAVATTARKAARGLQDLANVGPATLADLHTLGIRSVAQLARQDPLRLHRALRRRTGGTPACPARWMPSLQPESG